MDLAVITLTRGDRPAWLAECCSSVRLPRRCDTHQILQCGGEAFQETRWETTKSAGGYVAWVDDDDRVVGDALALCVRALDATGAGIAFTREVRIDVDGKPLPAAVGRPVSRMDVAMHPRALHHLAVVRADCLDPIVLQHALRIGIGIDWLMRAYAGLVHGAIHVPVVGYEWRQHQLQESVSGRWGNAYENAMPALRSVTRGWMGMESRIPHFMEPDCAV